tara:strand:- start:1852 stop:2961 length:1110 start_codon:yes stop_codon:yes gene_type:complete
MNIAFFIDKSQTVQSILGLIREAKKREYICSVYSTCSTKSLSNIPEADINLNNILWYPMSNRHEIKDLVLKNINDHDALVGINLFNNIWQDIYESDMSRKIHSVEYCWNEIYNGRKDYTGSSTLFANSEWSKKTIETITEYDNIKFLGSQWFEIISEFKRDPELKSRIITFMAPHNSFINNYDGFLNRVKIFLVKLREFCNKNSYKLILKTREKYSKTYHDIVSFDGVVTDSNIVSHLMLYAESRCVFNFSSSAINELAFLETPYVCLFSDYHANLHKNREDLFRSMSFINNQYYSGKIFDGIHCDMIPANDLLDNDRFLRDIDCNFEKVQSLICSKERNWGKFQKAYFPGDHKGASQRILNFIDSNAK